MGEASDLPESESALYDLATCADEDPYTRESAIKKLGKLDTEASTRQLVALTEEGVSAIERQLAQKYDDTDTGGQSSEPTSKKQADREPTELEAKLQRENEQFREALGSSGDDGQETEDSEPSWVISLLLERMVGRWI